ncbi:FUSC family protein [Streptomyces gardneri]|uniref:FUSC family protein n=1 Tax=Streptomyces gardneri TaxID=66892 RepID=UPI0035DF80C2
MLNGLGRTAARARSALSPRGALALQSVDGALSFALRAALAMALPALPMALAGRADQAVYAMLGSFTTTFGRNLPYARRARVLALVAVAMTACVGGGSALAAWADPTGGGAGAAVVVAATAVVAGIAKFACDAARLSGLGAVLLLFSFAVAANGSSTTADVLPHTLLAASGAAVAWVLALSGRFVHPDRPERLAVAAALRELADLLELPDRREAAGAAAYGSGLRRHRATAAVLQAYRTLGRVPPTAADAGRGDRDGTCLRLADLAWSLLIGYARRPPDDPTGQVRALRAQVRLLVSRRRRALRILPELARLSDVARLPDVASPSDPAPPSDPASPSEPAPPSDPALPSQPARPSAPARDGTVPDRESPDPTTSRAAGLRAARLLTGGRSAHASVLLVPALRMVLGTGLAGGAALLLGLGHGYWAAVSAAAVLHSVNVRTATQRAVQRTLGTVVGLALALGVLALRPEPVVLVLVIVLLEFLLEYVVARNYALGVVFLTPLALLMTDLAADSPTDVLIRDRALASVLGMGIALVCALLVVHDRAAVRAQRALAACTDAADSAEHALAAGVQASSPLVQTRLAAAVVELREADDAAAGELWPAEMDPVELAAAEQRAYRLLERLVRPQDRS